MNTEKLPAILNRLCLLNSLYALYQNERKTPDIGYYKPCQEVYLAELRKAEEMVEPLMIMRDNQYGHFLVPTEGVSSDRDTA